MAMNNSLAEVHPELVSEWSEKNIPLTPDDITFTGLGDYVWKYVFVCWTGRVPYTYLQSVLGETSVGEWLSFIPGCLIFTGISMVYYFWWVNHWEGNRISE